MTGKLTVDTASGHVTGPASISFSSPFPVPNGGYGSGAMLGVVMHTEVGDNPGTEAWFENPAAQASADFAIAQDGSVVQFGPIGKGWVAWAEANGNRAWYSIEHADDGNPANPLTPEQITASAQLAECLSAFAGFPLQVSDSPDVKGYGWHGMGGEAWGGHFDCPGNARKAQRAQIIALAMAIRSGGAHAGPFRHTAAAGQSLAQIAAARNTTPEHIFSVSARAYTAGDVAAISGMPLPAGFPYYTSNP